MIHDWNPQTAPTWVTCVPSLRHPDLVPNFANHLAAALGLPFPMVIAKTDARPEQKTDDLVSADAVEILRACKPVIDENRLQRLLARGFLLSQVIERWQARHLRGQPCRCRLPPTLESATARKRTCRHLWLWRYESAGFWRTDWK
jgi:hypothetical protein